MSPTLHRSGAAPAGPPDAGWHWDLVLGAWGLGSSGLGVWGSAFGPKPQP